MSGKLYVVATPIGNLEDMVPRATRVLQSVDLVLAEDTRRSGALLQHLGVSKAMRPYHDHNEDKVVDEMLQRLQRGEQIALVSDAGTPLIADPGFAVVRAARQAGVQVEAIPGACAAVLALSAAGLPVDRFLFLGFPPAKARARREWLNGLGQGGPTLVFYEAPHRILKLLEDAAAVWGERRQLVVARELTKQFETWYSGTAAEVLASLKAHPEQQKGEFVVVVEAATETAVDEAEIRRYMQVLLAEMPLGKAAATAAKLLGVRRQDCYQLGLALSE